MPGVGCKAAWGAVAAVAACLSTAAAPGVAAAGGKLPAEPAHATASAGPLEPPPEPLEFRKPPAPLFTVRPLASLRERLIRGSGDDPQGQLSLIEAMAAELARFDASVWQDARNRLALVSFTLGGGDPALLRKVAESDLFGEPEKPLAHGSLAYAEGHFEAAAELLGKVDARTLPASLAGRTALVKAVLLARSDAAAALDMCRLARAVSPGTIVDEAALRMTVELAALASDTGEFRRGLSRLVWRFPQTPFLSSILGQIASYIAGQDESAEPDAVLWLEDLVSALRPDQRIALIEQIADGALRSGRYRLVLEAARIGLEDAPEEARHRLKAYSAAANLVGTESAPGLELANELATKPLPPSLEEMLRMARLLGEMISAPAISASVASPGEGSVAVAAMQDAVDASPQEAAWMATFHKRMSKIDEAIEESLR